MLCDGCGDTMQRETIVLVTRVRGRSRSFSQPGWYCWTCKTSKHAAGDLLDPEASRTPRRMSRHPARLAPNVFA